jgi:hypothetical protein
MHADLSLFPKEPQCTGFLFASATACYSDRHHAAIVRSMDGRLQHISQGHLDYELTGLGQDFAPIALAADGRVVLVGSSKGSLLALPWPKEVPATNGPPFSASLQDLLGGGRAAAGAGGSTSPRKGLGATQGSLEGTGTFAGAQGGHSPQGTGALAATLMGAAIGSRPGTAGSQLKTTQGSAGFNGSSTIGRSGGEGGGGDAREFRLHSSRIVAIKVLHSQGLLFTARCAETVLDHQPLCSTRVSCNSCNKSRDIHSIAHYE